ncbi:MAG: hypothetical protein ACLQDQ_07295 [Myxococcaceae bacterium]
MQSAVRRLAAGFPFGLLPPWRGPCTAFAVEGLQPMLDTLFVAIAVVFFAAAFGYAWACSRV